MGRHESGGDWTTSLTPADLGALSCGCYPFTRSQLRAVPFRHRAMSFDIAADVFRHEPSREIDRFSPFRMREYVCIGGPDQVSAFRQRWDGRAKEIADRLSCCPTTVEQASDPFFGRMGQMKAVAQLQAALKFELLIPVRSHEKQPPA